MLILRGPIGVYNPVYRLDVKLEKWFSTVKCTAYYIYTRDFFPRFARIVSYKFILFIILFVGFFFYINFLFFQC